MIVFIGFSLLLGSMDRAIACSLIPTPTGFIPPPLPTPTLHERVAVMIPNANLIVEGEVIDTWITKDQEIMAVEVKRYLKGEGAEIIRLTRNAYPCGYGYRSGSKGVFFAQGMYVNNEHFHYLEHFAPSDVVADQVTNTIGGEPFIPARSLSLTLMVGLFTIGSLFLTIVLALLFRLKRKTVAERRTDNQLM